MIYKKYKVLLPIVIATIAGGILAISRSRFLSNSSCGCGIPSPEATGEFLEGEKFAIFAGNWLEYQEKEIPSAYEALSQQQTVLGVQVDEKWIEVDLSEQKLYAWEGNRLVYEFLISSGKWAPTPTGEFRIWIKLKYTKMEGGRRGTRTYYYLPNVPYTQYFYKGYGLHGTYWHNNFGQPMSHGCINLSIPDAEKLFYWTSPPILEGKNVVYPSKDYLGTRVVIHN